jgi:hypothetical protein
VREGAHAVLIGLLDVRPDGRIPLGRTGGSLALARDVIRLVRLNAGVDANM